MSPSSAAHAACAAGPIWLNLHPDSAGITVSEQLTPDRSRYSFAFSACAGDYGDSSLYVS